MVGGDYVGKTAIRFQYTDKAKWEAYDPTIEDAFRYSNSMNERFSSNSWKYFSDTKPLSMALLHYWVRIERWHFVTKIVSNNNILDTAGQKEYTALTEYNFK